MSQLLSEELRVECEEIALDLREQLGLAPEDPLDPRFLAEELLAIKVLTIEHYRRIHPDAVGQLAERDAEAFDAVMVFHETRCLIVVNPSQGAAEEALSIAHEIAHIELEHERLEAPLFDEQGNRRSWHPKAEAEAEYLAREMLVPKRALGVVLAGCGGNRRETARHFGVSPGLLRLRLLETGTLAVQPGLGVPDEEGQFSIHRLGSAGAGGEPATAGSTG